MCIYLVQSLQLNSAWLSSTQLDSAQFSSIQLNLAQFSSIQLNSAQFSSLSLTQLSPSWIDSAQLSIKPDLGSILTLRDRPSVKILLNYFGLGLIMFPKFFFSTKSMKKIDSSLYLNFKSHTKKNWKLICRNEKKFVVLIHVIKLAWYSTMMIDGINILGYHFSGIFVLLDQLEQILFKKRL